MSALRHRRVLLALLASALVVFPSAGALAAGPTRAGALQGNTAPIKLIAEPVVPQSGHQIHLVVTGLEGQAPQDVRWDLTGDGAFSLDTGATPNATTTIDAPGVHHLAVQVRTTSATLLASTAVLVRPAVAPSASAGSHKPAPTPVKPAHVERARHSTVLVPLAHAAGDPGVTIADFNFSPGTTTIHAGDTITWTNNGPSSHTATARNGSFNTGVLAKGKSASHTFSQPGTYSYFCSIHPFMHGTIVVLASSTTPSSHGGTTSGQTTTTPTATTATSSAGQLPVTGMNLMIASSIGFLLVGLGLGLRRGLKLRLAGGRFGWPGKGPDDPGVKEGK